LLVKVDDKEKEYIEKGLAARKFFKQFSLRNDVVVDEATMEDGVLTVKLGVNKPEEIKDSRDQSKIMFPYNEEEWVFISTPLIPRP